jgi:uncharacterized protein
MQGERHTGAIMASADFLAFRTVFLSILIQAFPFLLVGIFISSALNIFVPDQWIIRIFPVRGVRGFVAALFAGIFFPICECAIVPVMARLVKKGVAVPIAVTFMLAAPIINPISIISTFYAFPGKPFIALLRVGLGLLIALLTGLFLLPAGVKGSVSLFEHDLEEGPDDEAHNHTHAEHGGVCCCGKEEHHSGKTGRFKRLLVDSGEEFFEVGRYLIAGALITSLILTVLPQGMSVGTASCKSVSLLVMMAMAFLFCACSTSDAFIARSFMNKFPLYSIMGFLIFGPMMDMKSVFMLLANFKKKFVLRLCLLVALLNFAVLSMLSIWIR